MPVTKKKAKAVRKAAPKLPTLRELVREGADLDAILDKIDDEIAENNGKRNKRVETLVLTAIQLGLNSEEAAEIAGIAGRTVRKWLKNDDEFGALAAKAKARGKLRKAIYLERLCASGDTTATIFYLKTHSQAFYQDPTQLIQGGEKTVREVHFVHHVPKDAEEPSDDG